MYLFLNTQEKINSTSFQDHMYKTVPRQTPETQTPERQTPERQTPDSTNS